MYKLKSSGDKTDPSNSPLKVLISDFPYMSVNFLSILPIKLMILVGISKSFSFFRSICLDIEL